MKSILGFKGWMAENHVTQTELAKLLGLSITSVHLKVNGKVPFTLEQVSRICETYGISADIFLPKELK